MQSEETSTIESDELSSKDSITIASDELSSEEKMAIEPMQLEDTDSSEEVLAEEPTVEEPIADVIPQVKEPDKQPNLDSMPTEEVTTYNEEEVPVKDPTLENIATDVEVDEDIATSSQPSQVTTNIEGLGAIPQEALDDLNKLFNE